MKEGPLYTDLMRGVEQLSAERDQLRQQLKQVTRERDGLAESCTRLIGAVKRHQLCGVPEIKTVDDVIKGLASVADKMESVVLRQRVAELEAALGYMVRAAEHEFKLNGVTACLHKAMEQGQRALATPAPDGKEQP